ncbi:unnamed protein product [Ascophyllum nodosum]
MAARAFLRLSEDLREGFAKAQDDETLRFLRVEIVDEDTLTIVGSRQRGDLQTDFDSLAEEAVEATPSIFLVSLDPEELKMVTGKAAGAARQWLLVAWIPDDSKVRDKMLYSSSKQDIRQGLGLGFFEGEYYANVKSDLNFDSLVASRRSVTGDQLLSEAELLKRELNKQERASDAGMKSAAMGVMPFTIHDEVRNKLRAFGEGVDGVNWVEMRMDGEQVAIVEAKNVPETASLETLVNQDEPRFVLLRREDIKFLVYSCPEASTLRERMISSSSKASVAAAASEEGTTVDHMIEIKAADEIDSVLADAIRARAGLDDSGEARPANGERAMMTSGVPAVARPNRPGRGRARLTKRS